MSDHRNLRVQQRAYEIWEREGRPEGQDADHWHRAIREIEDEDALKPAAARASTPSPASAKPPKAAETPVKPTVDRAPPASAHSAEGVAAKAESSVKAGAVPPPRVKEKGAAMPAAKTAPPTAPEQQQQAPAPAKSASPPAAIPGSPAAMPDAGAKAATASAKASTPLAPAAKAEKATKSRDDAAGKTASRKKG